MKTLIEKSIELILEYGLQFLGALVAIILGLWLIGIVTKQLAKVLKRADLDPSLTSFSISLLNITLKVLLGIVVLEKLGLQMTSFVAVLGAAGLAVGMALSGTLQNFASGVMILLFKPFKVGDIIDGAGYVGVVHEIQIFNTILKTPQDDVIIIPNNSLANGSLKNLTQKPLKRAEWTVGIAYGDDVDQARAAILALLNADKRVLIEPDAPMVAVGNLGASSVDLIVRCWVKNEHYWDVFFAMNELFYKELPNKGINFPFPQLEVHLQK